MSRTVKLAIIYSALWLTMIYIIEPILVAPALCKPILQEECDL